ncbi:sulfotransferase domain-containing protein [Faunimonas sp. B44]|uniref:sulfotransferase domain-containing protein n=1 Tax=Faunimonas sp. B44 TaxID=3461493 RepID=UPI004044A075
MRRDFISFPKSGRSWLRFALHHLGVADQINFHHDGFEYNNGSKPPLDFDFAARRARYGDGRAIVYLSREPRDVMVSLYHQVTGRFADFFGYAGSISEFIRDPYFGAANLAAFQAQWSMLCAEGIALPITYEACHADFRAVLGRVLAHYGFALPPSALDKAVEAASFANMRVLEASGRFSEPWLRRRNGAPKVRKGQVGSFAVALPAEDLAYLDEVFGGVEARVET